jgi:NitT/TauT family transport system ATP-binding protein
MGPGRRRGVSAPLIQIGAVSKTFDSRRGRVHAVDQVSLEIAEGEVTVLVGASGCGKSTLLNMVAGFLRPSSGQVLIAGRPIRDVEPRCGMIFQSYALFPWLSVRDNVAFGPRMKGWNRTQRHAQADRWIAKVGLDGFETAYPEELSGGMRQRVALARALANEPDILLCDEPFAALDAMTRQLMQQELLNIVQESGKTVLFITHSIDEALILSDRLVVMSARPGRIKSVYDNHLPRPRKLDMQLTAEYLDLKRRIWDQVQEEVMGSITAETGRR